MSIQIFPQTIYESVGKKVKGQEAAKKALSTLLGVHYTNLHNSNSDVGAQRILLAGPTGCGKTHLVTEIMKCLKNMTPIVVFVNSSELTGSGWAGENLSGVNKKIVNQLVSKMDTLNFSQYEISYQKQLIRSLALQVIYVFDEFDKMSNARDEHKYKTYIQDDMLNFIESKELSVKIHLESTLAGEVSCDETIIIKNRNCPIIFLGAFSDFKLFDKSEVIHHIGFDAKDEIKAEKHIKDKLFDAGFSRELIGRITNVVQLTKLTENELNDILISTILPEFINSFNLYNISLKFSTSFIKEVAKEATTHSEGARVLKELVQNILTDYLFDSEKYQNKTLLFSHISEKAKVVEQDKDSEKWLTNYLRG